MKSWKLSRHRRSNIVRLLPYLKMTCGIINMKLSFLDKFACRRSRTCDVVPCLRKISDDMHVPPPPLKQLCDIRWRGGGGGGDFLCLTSNCAGLLHTLKKSLMMPLMTGWMDVKNQFLFFLLVAVMCMKGNNWHNSVVGKRQPYSANAHQKAIVPFFPLPSSSFCFWMGGMQVRKGEGVHELSWRTVFEQDL